MKPEVGTYYLLRIEEWPTEGEKFDAVDLVRVEAIVGDTVTLYSLVYESETTDTVKAIAAADYRRIDDELADDIYTGMRTFAHQRALDAANVIRTTIHESARVKQA